MHSVHTGSAQFATALTYISAAVSNNYTYRVYTRSLARKLCSHCTHSHTLSRTHSAQVNRYNPERTCALLLQNKSQHWCVVCTCEARVSTSKGGANQHAGKRPPIAADQSRCRTRRRSRRSRRRRPASALSGRSSAKRPRRRHRTRCVLDRRPLVVKVALVHGMQTISIRRLPTYVVDSCAFLTTTPPPPPPFSMYPSFVRMLKLSVKNSGYNHS